MRMHEAVLVCVVAVAVLAAVWADVLLIGWIVRKIRGGRTGGADAWQLRGTRCGRARGAGEAGLVRLGAFSVAKYTLGYCAGCGERLRIIAIERKPAPADAHLVSDPVGPLPASSALS